MCKVLLLFLLIFHFCSIQNKQRKLDSPKSDSVDENEFINQRGGSPLAIKHDRRDRERSPRSPSQQSDDSHDTEESSDRSKEEERGKEKRKQREKQRMGGNNNNNKRNKNNRDRNKNRDRDRRGDLQLKDSQGICVFFLQGKCQKVIFDLEKIFFFYIYLIIGIIIVVPG